MTDNPPVIDLHGVEKRFGRKVHALRGVDLRVFGGEVFGLLGPNGAGKSTLVKCMLTVVRPTHAEGTVLGKPLGHKPTLARVGYLPEHARFPRHLTGRQVVGFYGAMAKMPRTLRRKRTDELIDLVGATDYADRRVGGYSKGMQQRIGLAQAMVNDPDLIVLDEPTDGVDPVGRRDIRDVLKHLRDRGKTVFINSHLLSELEAICDRVAILVNGKVARQGRMEDLTIDQRFYRVGLDTTQGAVNADTIGAALGIAFKQKQANARDPILRSERQGVWFELQGPELSIGVEEPKDAWPIIDQLRAAGLMVRSIQPMRPSLEDLFMQVAEHASTDGGVKR